LWEDTSIGPPVRFFATRLVVRTEDF
jgi:hypothetical protein